jgi:AcrR family transcriptional regulator
MSLRERQREAAVTAIIEAATTVFCEHGFHRTSMEDIARACDCAPATIYGYFKGKEALFMAIMERHITVYFAGVQAAVTETEDFTSGLRAYLDNLTRFGTEHTGFVRLLDALMREGSNAHPKPEELEAIEQAYLVALDTIVRRGLDEGLLREDAPAHALTASLIGLAHANAGLWIYKKAEDDLGPYIDFAGTLFMQGATRRDA